MADLLSLIFYWDVLTCKVGSYILQKSPSEKVMNITFPWFELNIVGKIKRYWCCLLLSRMLELPS